MDLFKLVGSIFIDNTAANESLQKTDKEAGKTANSLKNTAANVGKFAVGVGAAAAGAGAALFKMASDSSNAADTVDKGSKRMGISTKSYQELSFAAGQCGIDMSTMEKAAKKLEGTDMSFDDAIAQIMALGTEEERSAKAADLFGDAVAYNLSPMLAMTGEEMDGLRQQANDLGIVMSEDAVSAGVDMKDTMTAVQKSFGAVAASVGTQVMPIIQKLLDWIVEHMPQIQAAVGKVMGFITGTVVPAVSAAIDFLLPIVQTVFQGISFAWNNVLKPVFTTIVTTIGNIKRTWDTIFGGMYDKVKTVFNNIIGAVKAPLNTVIGIINKGIRGINNIGFDVPKLLGGGHVGFNIPTIPLLAKGGVVDQTGAAIVGEDGAEMVTLPRGAAVTPLNARNNPDFGEMIKLLVDIRTLLTDRDTRIVMDSGALVGALAPAMDKELGRRAAYGRR